MISKTMRAILHTLSYGNIEVESSRRLVDIKKLDAMNIFLKKMDIQIFNEDYEIPLRIYFPTEEAMTNGVEKGHTFPVLLFFHGGGWVTESVDTYNRVCARMSQSTGHIVVSVEYRLAPEYRFPTALMDCYAAAKALYTNKLILNTDPRKITIMGDSAGGNLSNMPETLILTAEFDPLRDEGEDYGKKLAEAGNYVEVHRIKDALHGFFALGIRFFHVQESFSYMNEFLKREV